MDCRFAHPRVSRLCCVPGPDVDSIVPLTLVAVGSRPFVAACTISPPNVTSVTYCIVELSAADASLHRKWCSTDIVLDNVAFDGARLLATGYVLADRRHAVFEANATGLIPVAHVPRNVSISVAASALSPVSRRWYLLNNTSPTENSLLFVDLSDWTVHRVDERVDFIVSLLLNPAQLRGPDGVLAWTIAADGSSTSLVALALASPPRVLAVYANQSADGGQAVGVAADGTVRARLLDATSSAPSWTIVDPAHAGPGPLLPLPLYPWVLSMAVVAAQ